MYDNDGQWDGSPPSRERGMLKMEELSHYRRRAREHAEKRDNRDDKPLWPPGYDVHPHCPGELDRGHDVESLAPPPIDTNEIFQQLPTRSRPKV